LKALRIDFASHFRRAPQKFPQRLGFFASYYKKLAGNAKELIYDALTV